MPHGEQRFVEILRQLRGAAGAWRRSGGSWRRAIELNPNVASAQATYAHFLLIMGHGEEALAHSIQSTELDPLNSLYISFYGDDLRYEHRFDDAIAASRRALKMAPENPNALAGLPIALQLKGQYAEAIVEQGHAYALSGDREMEEALNSGYQQGGHKRAWRRAAEVLAARPGASELSAVTISLFYVFADEKERALEWLEKAVEARDPNVPYLSDPGFDSLRNDPHFQNIQQRMRLDSASLARAFPAK